MSVIVTGMKMPEKCSNCKLRKPLKLHPDDCLVCGCPLKSVDGLIEKLNKAGADNDKSVFKNLHPSYVQGLKDAVKIVKEYCGAESGDAE